MIRPSAIINKSIPMVCIMAAAAFCQLRDHWYLFRVEVNTTEKAEELGCGAGIYWNMQELDEPPCDAFGVTAGAAVMINNDENIPCPRIGVNARWGFFCARTSYSLYKPRDRGAVSVLNPQIGLSYQSIISLYAGYNQPLFGRSLSGIKGINMSLCMNIPSYCLKD